MPVDEIIILKWTLVLWIFGNLYVLGKMGLEELRNEFVELVEFEMYLDCNHVLKIFLRLLINLFTSYAELIYIYVGVKQSFIIFDIIILRPLRYCFFFYQLSSQVQYVKIISKKFLVAETTAMMTLSCSFTLWLLVLMSSIKGNIAFLNILLICNRNLNRLSFLPPLLTEKNYTEHYCATTLLHY